MFNNFFFEKVPFEIKWKNIWTGNRWQYGTCALHAKHLRLQTHSQYLILTAFPWQQWWHKHTSMLCCT